MVAPTTKTDKQGNPLALRVMNNLTSADSSPTTGADPAANGKSTDAPAKTAKKNKSDTRGKISQQSADFIKGSRGTDTLLRNAYRSQLDMLALAATKANIMISLNGLLMSMLIIAGTHLIAINGLYVVPIGIFLLTCAIATTFAVFAARPEISRKTFSLDDFMCDDARLMVFEEFSDLHESDYIDAMTALLASPDRTYRSMLAHIYDLGKTADKKYRHLYYSYTVFMAGTIVTVLSMFVLAMLRWSGVIGLV